MIRTLLITMTVCLMGAHAACDEETRPDGGKGLLPVGARAPEVRGLDAQDKPVTLSSLRDQKLALVYFYPKDETPGCTKEACALRDAFAEYEKAGVVIFGVSRDSDESHREFRKSHELPFPLVADEAGTIQAAYGVPSRLPGMAARVSFLVDRAGRIARVWPDVDPALHAQEVLAAARTLK